MKIGEEVVDEEEKWIEIRLGTELIRSWNIVYD